MKGNKRRKWGWRNDRWMNSAFFFLFCFFNAGPSWTTLVSPPSVTGNGPNSSAALQHLERRPATVCLESDGISQRSASVTQAKLKLQHFSGFFFFVYWPRGSAATSYARCGPERPGYVQVRRAAVTFAEGLSWELSLSTPRFGNPDYSLKITFSHINRSSNGEAVQSSSRCRTLLGVWLLGWQSDGAPMQTTPTRLC